MFLLRTAVFAALVFALWSDTSRAATTATPEAASLPVASATSPATTEAELYAERAPEDRVTWMSPVPYRFTQVAETGVTSLDMEDGLRAAGRTDLATQWRVARVVATTTMIAGAVLSTAVAALGAGVIVASFVARPPSSNLVEGAGEPWTLGVVGGGAVVITSFCIAAGGAALYPVIEHLLGPEEEDLTEVEGVVYGAPGAAHVASQR